MCERGGNSNSPFTDFLIHRSVLIYFGGHTLAITQPMKTRCGFKIALAWICPYHTTDTNALAILFLDDQWSSKILKQSILWGCNVFAYMHLRHSACSSCPFVSKNCGQWEKGRDLLFLTLFQGGSYILDVVDGYVVGFPTLFVGLFELVCIAWVYGEHVVTGPSALSFSCYCVLLCTSMCYCVLLCLTTEQTAEDLGIEL